MFMIRKTTTPAYLHDLCDLLPLLLGRVGAGGVVCAGVKDKDGVFWSFLLRKVEKHKQYWLVIYYLVSYLFITFLAHSLAALTKHRLTSSFRCNVICNNYYSRCIIKLSTPKL